MRNISLNISEKRKKSKKILQKIFPLSSYCIVWQHTFDFFGQISVNKLPQETIDTLLKNANILAVSEDSKFRIGEEKLTSGQKQLFMTYVSRVLQGVSGVSREEIIFSYKKYHKPYSLLQLFYQSLNTKQRKKETKKTVNIIKNTKSQKDFSIFDGQENKIV